MYETAKLAECIKNRAKAQNIKLNDLFSACNLGRNTMAHLTNGRVIASDSLAKIADKLNCSMDYLMGRTDNPDINL